MKAPYLKILAFASVTAAFIACGGDKKTDEAKITAVEKNEAASDAPVASQETAGNFAKGQEVYKQNCQACHQENGLGLPNAFPPLASSDYLLADKGRLIKQIIYGSSGEITVNGVVYNGTMPPLPALTDDQVMDVANYVLNSWGNNGGTVSLEDVKAQRK